MRWIITLVDRSVYDTRVELKFNKFDSDLKEKCLRTCYSYGGSCYGIGHPERVSIDYVLQSHRALGLGKICLFFEKYVVLFHVLQSANIISF